MGSIKVATAVAASSGFLFFLSVTSVTDDVVVTDDDWIIDDPEAVADDLLASNLTSDSFRFRSRSFSRKTCDCLLEWNTNNRNYFIFKMVVKYPAVYIILKCFSCLFYFSCPAFLDIFGPSTPSCQKE